VRARAEGVARSAAADDQPTIYVLAGCNGAGKSTLGGAAFRAHGIDPFDPDRAARIIAQTRGSTSVTPAINAEAWEHGRRLLARAIDERASFAFETTLGGSTMTELLALAMRQGLAVKVWFVGLADVRMHVERVRKRVAKGGHDIPAELIRQRYAAGRRNLVALLPGLREVYLHDNSREGDPDAGRAPSPHLVMHAIDRRIVAPRSLGALMTDTPAWAKPVVAASLKLHLRQSA
jgi:predicted ABC-type ATPase